MLTLPNFDAVQPAEIAAKVDGFIANIEHAVEALASVENPTWSSFESFGKVNEAFGKYWSPVSHLNSVKNSPELRDAYNAQLPKISQLYTALGQNEKLCALYQKLKQNNEHFDAEQRAVIEHALRDFRLAGVDLSDEKKAEYQKIASKLSELNSKFSNNVLDATQAWSKHITDASELDGLSESALALAKQLAEQKDKDGFVVTLDFPSYYPVMQYAKNRELRKEVYEAYVTKASEHGPNAGEFDNAEIMRQILQCRYDLAQLLGFDSYADKSLATKMADSVDQVIGFLTDLAKASKPKAEQEFAELVAFAKDKDGIDNLYAWDMAYYSEQLKEEKYAINDEQLRPYFPLPQVVDGMFDIVAKLFGIRVAHQEQTSTYHEDVNLYHVFNAEDMLIAAFYLDPFAREHKRGGAWMDGFSSRDKKPNGEIELPVAYLTCNFSPAIGDQPALLTHDEVQTLFHEFGHGLHHMLTQVSIGDVAGISGVEWDAVELPSQLLENWCWQPEGLTFITSHVDTGETLPKAMLDKMLAAKNYHAALGMVRQLEFALFDMRLHAEYSTSNPVEVYDVLAQVRTEVSVMPVPEFNRFANSFGHIFAGGYAAGYYSYKWAEVLSADFFTEFVKNGIFDTKTGQHYLDCFLGQGSVKSSADMCQKFLGREPTVDALLKQDGIT